MRSYAKIAVLTFAILAGSVGTAVLVNASTLATMPVIYNQYGTPLNTGAGHLAAGNYFVGGGSTTGGHQVEYYGNGTFYDPMVKIYGGSVNDPNGTAGVTLNYVAWFNNGFTMATMPALFNQNNVQVNASNGYLTAGYYYLGSNTISAGNRVYYYGNGVFYNQTTQVYGGSVTNPTGTANVSLGYSA